MTLGVVFLGWALCLAVRPKRAARTPKWQFENSESLEPSPLAVDFDRIGGIVWAAVGVAFVVTALAQEAPGTRRDPRAAGWVGIIRAASALDDPRAPPGKA